MTKRSKLRDSARGEMCSLLIPGVCRGRWDTTVLAHVGKHGSAKRNHDDEAVYACYECHCAIDFRDSKFFLSDNPQEQDRLHKKRGMYIQQALKRTKARLREKEYLPG